MGPSKSVHNRRLARIRLRNSRILRKRRFAAPYAQLGAAYSPAATTFRLFAPTARQVKLVVANAPQSDQQLGEHDMAADHHGLWETRIMGDLAGRYYAYKLSGPGLDPRREVTDLYAVCAQTGQTRAMIIDLVKTDPPGFRDHLYHRPSPPANVVIWEVHVRDFSIAASSGAAHPGKYLAFTELGIHLLGHPEVSTGIDHLRELGVTHVQLLPVQAFDKRNIQDANTYNWGYMPVHFNSPDAWFASSSDGPACVTELKAAIHALHQAGIGVILDVVYNHTSPLAAFEAHVPGYYYRLDGRGRFGNGSGCGNEFQTENPMARKFILDSLKFWVREYQVDGFRFDMMGLIDFETMRTIRDELCKIDPGILIHGEPWTAARTRLRNQSDKTRMPGTGIAAFNDEFRDAIKGDREGIVPGFVQTGVYAARIRRGLAGVAEHWPASPLDTLNYFECHDNLTAWDKLLVSTPGASVATRERMMRFAALILLCSQGRILLHAGQEFCRTKQGCTNSYNKPDSINQLDWTAKLNHRSVFGYLKGLIAFRKNHPALRLADAAEVRKRVSFPESPSVRSVVCRINGRELPGEPADSILVLLNGAGMDTTFKLPTGPWSLFADANLAGMWPLRHITDRILLPGHSGALLIQSGPALESVPGQ
ncbi:MAG TPA: type I pullulanase [Phycisphaerae bacterium]|nr:type I pullulanase [Phycisphaerae bacterium]HRY68939.1 type I pullulanase [Phycisphaerae bacterium]HSA25766.1 type I pullulanase [Phycisphaerae bacterium]